MKKIISIEIIISPFSAMNGNKTIMALFDDGSVENVFNYYSDELSFSEDELIGLTSKEAVQLKTEKYFQYLIS